jgi:hypothetical protein
MPSDQTTIPHDGCCPVCGGDCGGANPPVLACPMREPPHINTAERVEKLDLLLTLGRRQNEEASKR